MDRETELIRSQNWNELKRFYAARNGQNWELAWLHLEKLNDPQKAREYFRFCQRDPRYETAATILLWRLGEKNENRLSHFPPSLQLFNALLHKDWKTLSKFLSRSPDNKKYASFLIEACLEKFTVEDLPVVERFGRPAELSAKLGHHADRRLKDFKWAERFYSQFLNDGWAKKIVDDLENRVVSEVQAKKLKQAYANRDGVAAKQILKHLLQRWEANEKSLQGLSPLWRSAFQNSIRWELEHLTENLMGYPFWKRIGWSPLGVLKVWEQVFSIENLEEPEFSVVWKEFFSAKKLKPLPATLDPDDLSLWQIRVELRPDEFLSEALLRFPMEERFLTLWSLRNRDSQKTLSRLWPGEGKESEVVRKNLERAFERSSNKLLWFDRVRRAGCSQHFYEYAVSKVTFPLSWILDDLEKGVVTNTAGIRSTLKTLLTTSAANEPVDEKNLKKALSYLTPAEIQEVLLSRYVLLPLPLEALDDDAIDLFWDARDRVSSEVFQQWRKVIIQYVAAKPRTQWSVRHWQWIELSWELDRESLKVFSPSVQSSDDFPWEHYLEKLHAFEERDLLFSALLFVPNERLKESWLRILMEGPLEPRILRAIQSLPTKYVRDSLLAQWYERSGEIDKAFQFRESEWNDCPILNEQIVIACKMLELIPRVSQWTSPQRLQKASEIVNFLDRNGQLTERLLDELVKIYEAEDAFSEALRWQLIQWRLLSRSGKAAHLQSLLDLSFKARRIDETQRLLVSFVFENGEPDALTRDIIGHLTQEGSLFRLNHFRAEFIERCGSIFPLHRDLLRIRSRTDYRAVALWQSFYGEIERESASFSALGPKKRKYELWKMTEAESRYEYFGTFAKFFESLPAARGKSLPHEFLEKAKRVAHRLGKRFGFNAPEIRISESLQQPFLIFMNDRVLEIRREFFDLLDEDFMSALVVGYFQIMTDRKQGMYDPKRLAERCFQAMFLIAPLSKLIRLWVWIAMHEGLIEASLPQMEPEALMQKLPFLNALLIFYLGPDCALKSTEGAMPAL